MLPSALVVVVTLSRKDAVAVEVADRLGAAAVGIEHRDVGPGLVEAAGAVGIALRRHRQAIGARRRDGPVLQRAVAVEIGHRLGAAAVGVEHRHVGAGRVDHAIAVQIPLRGRLSPVALAVVTTAWSRSEPFAFRSLTVSVRLPSALRTVTSVWLWSNVPSPSMSPLGRDRQAVGAGGRDGPVLQRAVGVVVGNRRRSRCRRRSRRVSGPGRSSRRRANRFAS